MTFYMKVLGGRLDADTIIFSNNITVFICHFYLLKNITLVFIIRGAAGCIPIFEQFIIHTGNKELESGHFLYCQHFTNNIGNNFNTLFT